MKKIFVLLFLNFYPLIFLAQSENWAAPIEIIETEKKNIERTIYYESEGFSEDKDSLSVRNNQKFEDVIITLYHDEISMEPDVDYYVVGMDLSVMEFIDLKEKEQQITLVFSRNCNSNTNLKTRRLELNFGSEKAKDEVQSEFQKILKIRNSHHQKLHDLNQCNIGANY